MKEKRASVVAEMKRLQAETEVITKIFEDEDISKSIQSTRSVFFLQMLLSLTNSCVFLLNVQFSIVTVSMCSVCAQTRFSFGQYFTKKTAVSVWFPFFSAFSNFLHNQLAQFQA